VGAVAHTCHPATWEAEIRRIMVHASPGKEKFASPHLNVKKMGMVAPICLSSNCRKCKIRRMPVQANLGKK
jgi:hypothetical protein